MRWSAVAPAVLLAALACASVIEIWPRDQGFAGPREGGSCGWLDIVARIAPAGPAVYIPFPRASTFADHVAVTEQMLLARPWAAALERLLGFFPHVTTICGGAAWRSPRPRAWTGSRPRRPRRPRLAAPLERGRVLTAPAAGGCAGWGATTGPASTSTSSSVGRGEAP